MKLTKQNLPAIEAKFAKGGKADAIFFDEQLKLATTRQWPP
jgi:hypothetical protein